MKNITVGYGFESYEREPTGLEVSLGGILVRTDGLPDAIAAFPNQFVEVGIGGQRYMGVVVGRTGEGGYIIAPTIHRTPESLSLNAQQLPHSQRNEWSEDPIIVYGQVQEVSPVREPVLRAAATGFDRVEHLGKYQPAPKSKERSPARLGFL